MADYNIKWWSDYIDADILKRSEMVKKLPFITSVVDLCNSDISLKHKKDSISMMLMSFFDDCINEMEVRK